MVIPPFLIPLWRARPHVPARIGRVTVIVVPWPTTLSARISPSWLRKYAWLMLRPRPVPLPFLVVKNGSNTCGSTSGGIPQPVSLIRNLNTSLKGELAGGRS